MTSNHEGVSCNSCRKNNFRGLRYKCLICYDYDLCSACHEAGLTSTRHTVNHPMQCIVARNDFDLFYSGESVTSEQPQSLTCPLCGNLGFNEASLLEHVTNEHANSDNDESSAGIVCPICGVETNQLTYDFTTHLTMEHRTPRETVEQVAMRGRGGRCHTRASGPRGRRSQHYNTVGGPSGSSPTVRDSADPFVEILAQLSNVRRAGASHLRQLQMQLQSPSFSPRTATERNEVRIMRRTFQSMNNQLNPTTSASTSAGMQGIGGVAYTSANSHYSNSHPFILMDQGSLERGLVQSAAIGTGANGAAASLAGGASAAGLTGAPQHHTNHGLASIEGAAIPSTQYLLPSCLKPTLTEAELQQREIFRADRSLFVQDLLLQVGLLEKIK